MHIAQLTDQWLTKGVDSLYWIEHLINDTPVFILLSNGTYPCKRLSTRQLTMNNVYLKLQLSIIMTVVSSSLHINRCLRHRYFFVRAQPPINNFSQAQLPRSHCLMTQLLVYNVCLKAHLSCMYCLSRSAAHLSVYNVFYKA